jgi:hypothetical protein
VLCIVFGYHDVNRTPNVGFTCDIYLPRLAPMTDGLGTATYRHDLSFVEGAQQLQQMALKLQRAGNLSRRPAMHDALDYRLAQM